MKQTSISILLLLVLVSVGALSTGCSGLKDLALSTNNTAPYLSGVSHYPTFQSEIAAQAPPFEANLVHEKVGDFNNQTNSFSIIMPTARFLERKVAMRNRVKEITAVSSSTSKAFSLFPPVYRSSNRDANFHARTSLTLGIIGFLTAITIYGGLVCGILAIIQARKSKEAGEPDQKKARAGKAWGIAAIVAIPVAYLGLAFIAALLWLK